MQPSAPADDRYAAFRHRAFTLYFTARFLSTFALQIISVSVGWQIYDLTRDPFDLGLVGLIQFLPALVLILFTGAAADRYGRRTIMLICEIVIGLSALTLGSLNIIRTGSPGAILKMKKFAQTITAMVRAAATTFLKTNRFNPTYAPPPLYR